MGLFTLPDPVSMFESAKNAGLERDIAAAMVSASLSAAITGMWRSGSAKWAVWLGLGPALQDSATAMYATLDKQLQRVSPGLLVLTVPQEMLTAANLSKFQTESKEKTK